MGGRDRTGMTLVEMLVVLAIVGVSAGMVVLAVGGGRSDVAAQTEANRFADRIRLAADEALIASRPITVRMNPTGYAFGAVGSPLGDWADPHELPDGVRLSARDSEMTIDPDSSAPPVVLTMRDARQTWVLTFDGLNIDVRTAPTDERA